MLFTDEAKTILKEAKTNEFYLDLMIILRYCLNDQKSLLYYSLKHEANDFEELLELNQRWRRQSILVSYADFQLNLMHTLSALNDKTVHSYTLALTLLTGLETEVKAILNHFAIYYENLLPHFKKTKIKKPELQKH